MQSQFLSHFEFVREQHQLLRRWHKCLGQTWHLEPDNQESLRKSKQSSEIGTTLCRDVTTHIWRTYPKPCAKSLTKRL
ncbi:hypothetical protein DPMN_164216 [Dreissena polymorpha]|uniref:Uncharacterized protein n=1 Tax=Dreissena polymorpha TaxID=45954 RepID=A0A9D4ESI2_DREPO|nr:hypothetical protein DPMN_164216 [Dreissena polymorpha]